MSLYQISNVLITLAFTAPLLLAISFLHHDDSYCHTVVYATSYMSNGTMCTTLSPPPLSPHPSPLNSTSAEDGCWPLSEEAPPLEAGGEVLWRELPWTPRAGCFGTGHFCGERLWGRTKQTITLMYTSCGSGSWLRLQVSVVMSSISHSNLLCYRKCSTLLLTHKSILCKWFTHTGPPLVCDTVCLCVRMYVHTYIFAHVHWVPGRVGFRLKASQSTIQSNPNVCVHHWVLVINKM